MIFTSEFPPGPGGIGTHAFELADNLSRMRYEVGVLCEQHYADAKRIHDFNAQLTFPVIGLTHASRNSITKFSRRVHKLIELVRRHNKEVVIASGSSALWCTAFASLFVNFKMVAIAHGGELTFTSIPSRLFTRFSFRISDLVIGVSKFTASYLPSSLTPRKVKVINNGANHYLFQKSGIQNDLKRKYGFEGKRVLLTVGSVTERKGQDTVIKALPKCKAEVTNIIYVMAGRSDYYDMFKEMARQERVSDEVFFRGSVDTSEIIELYNLADIYILNSRHSAHGDFEGFGISVIEAALCGLPSIVSKNSGLEEAIVDGITGLAIEPDNPNETAKAIVRLFKNDQLRMEMGEAARQRAHSQFTWESITKQYSEVLDAL